MTWHTTYREQVLAPDFRFAATYLKPHFLHALTAHVRTVKRLGTPAVLRHQGTSPGWRDPL